MANFLVTVKYNPGTPKMYLVEDVLTHREACAKLVQKVLLYDPGVPVEATQVPVHKNKPLQFANLGGSHQ